MSDERHADRAARVLRARAPAMDSRVSRDVGIGLVAQGMSLARRRRHLCWALGGGFGAAAAVLAVVLGWPRAQPALTATATSCTGPACTGVPSGATVAEGQVRPSSLGAGQALVAPVDAPARAALASGARIVLAAGGAVECREDGPIQRLQLTKGSVHLEVNKLGAGERFLVSTPDSEVEVRGTAFDVTIEAASEACAARTSVAVEHGVVDVRSKGGGAVLHAGDRWSSPCMSPVAVSAPSAVAPHVERQRSSGVVAAMAANAPTPTAPPSAAFAVDGSSAQIRSSALREQNDLYEQAEAARRGGRDGEASALYTRLLTGFERGPLTESATVGRVRTLARVDPARARAEAERYLARFPLGFARAEMKRLAGPP